jgi:hypothetical protein
VRVREFGTELPQSPSVSSAGPRRRHRRYAKRIIPYVGIALAALGVFAGVLGALGLLAGLFD